MDNFDEIFIRIRIIRMNRIFRIRMANPSNDPSAWSIAHPYFETPYLTECRVSVRVPRARIEGAVFLDISRLEEGGKVRPTTMVYFSDDAEKPYLDIRAASGLGLWLGSGPFNLRLKNN